MLNALVLCASIGSNPIFDNRSSPLRGLPPGLPPVMSNPQNTSNCTNGTITSPIDLGNIPIIPCPIDTTGKDKTQDFPWEVIVTLGGGVISIQIVRFALDCRHRQRDQATSHAQPVPQVELELYLN
jgi:hypothetical protein